MRSFNFEWMQRELLWNLRWSRGESRIVCFIHWWLLSILLQFSHWMVWPAWFLLLCKHCYSVITIHLLHETSVYAAFSFWKRFMLHLECHLLQDSLCVFPWTSSKISDGFIFPLHRHCIPLLILSLSIKRSESGAFCDTSCLQVQLMYSLCRYSLDVSLCLVLRWTTSSWYVVRMSEVAHVLYQFIQHSAMYFLDMHK